MNERIKEIAFRAGFIGESMNPIFGTSQETALKNFAELIVRECIHTVEHHGGMCGATSGQRLRDRFELND